MALAALATMSDLVSRTNDLDPGLSALMLDVASSLVREAAGSPILATTATFDVWATERNQYLGVPVRPLRSVSSVTIDGSAVSDYKLIDGDLWRWCGWFWCEPAQVTITGVIGIPAVPEHIKQLVCDLAILGTKAAADGAIDPRVVAESVDDYSVKFADGAEAVSSAMHIPEMTRLALRTRFGGGAGSVKFK